MKQKNRVPLYVEPLEDRWVPATVRLIGSSLYISNPLVVNGSTSIALTATAANSFNVTDQGHNLGTYNVGGNIYLLGSNAKDVLTVDLKGNSYGGSFLINGMNGNDSISVQNTGAAATIGGNLTVLPGLGADSVGLNTAGSGALTVGGTVTAANQTGADTFAMGNGSASTTVGGDVNLTGFAAVVIGAGDADHIGGNLSVNSTQVNTGATVTLGTGASGVSIGKNFTFTGGTGSDSVVVSGADTIAGNVNVNLGTAAGSTVGSLTFGSGAIVYGNLNVQSGSANTTITTAAAPGALTVQGNAAFNLGDGNNNFLPTGDINVQGNLQITEGNGNDTITIDPPSAGPSSSSVNGNLFITLGNGTDSVSVGAAVGGTVYYRSGNGLPGDILQLGNAGNTNNYNVNAQFGNGDDTFTLATTGLVSGTVDGGGRVLGNVFNQGSATLSSVWTLSNFP